MSNYKIITESTTDLSPQLIKELNVHVIPMMFAIEGETYNNDPEGSELSFADFYAKLRNGSMSTTSQVSILQFRMAAEPYLKQGLDILHLGFSSGLSGTFNACSIAAEELLTEYPDRKIIVLDTLAASMGEGLLVWHAAKQQQAGKTIQEVASWITENHLKMAHWFTVDDLNHLKRGGRVSGTAALVGTMLNIKPVLRVDDEGHLIPMEKVRGRKHSLDALVNHMKNSAINPEEQTIFISHGDCLSDANYVAEKIKTEIGVKEIHINFIGPVIGAHSGPGTVALFYLAKNRA